MAGLSATRYVESPSLTSREETYKLGLRRTRDAPISLSWADTWLPERTTAHTHVRSTATKGQAKAMFFAPLLLSCDRTPAAPRASESDPVRHLGRRLIAAASLP